MAKEYKVGGQYYIPASAVSTQKRSEDDRYPITVSFRYSNKKTQFFTFANEPDLLLTAEEIAFVINTERDDALEKLEAENEKLKRQLDGANELLTDAEDQVKKLTEADCMRLQEFKPIVAERDRLKGELEQEKKRTQVWKDSSEEHRQRAEELEGDVNRYGMEISDYEMKLQTLGQENDSLKADILELKAQINAFGNGEDRETLKKKLNAHEKIATIHRKAIMGLGKTVKEKDCIISALVKRVMELEKGGESNG